MKNANISRTVLSPFARVGVTVIGLFTAVAPGTLAKGRSTNSAKQSISVVAHVALPESSTTQMLLQEKNTKQYLYIVSGSDGGLLILDVTKPEKAQVLRHVGGSKESTTGKLHLIGDGLALFTALEQEALGTGRPIPTTQSVSVLNLDDPTNPQEVRKFLGVTSILSDQDRGLIYLAKSEGLWILKQRQNRYQPPSDYMVN